MKTAKKSPMDEYLKKHPFLAETANLQLAMEKILTGAVSPVSFPEKDDIANLVKDGMPLLQQPQLQRTMVKVAAVSLGDCLEALKDIEAPEMMKAGVKAWQSWTAEAELTEIQQFFDYLLRQEDAEIQSFAADNKLNEALVRTLGWQLVEALVPATVGLAAGRSLGSRRAQRPSFLAGHWLETQLLSNLRTSAGSRAAAQGAGGPRPRARLRWLPYGMALCPPWLCLLRQRRSQGNAYP